MTQLGSKNHKAKLQERHVQPIKQLHEYKYTNEEIAVMFGVSRKTIWRIVKNKGWRHVKI